MKSLWIYIGASALVLAILTGSWVAHAHSRSAADRLLLLVPDGTSLSDPKVTVWLDAGSEEGLHIVPVHDSEFARPFFGESQGAGVILPDSIHQQASDLFVVAMHHFVASGGKLMLVYDAGTLTANGIYAPVRSRFSDLAGIDYALYDQFRDHTAQWSEVAGKVGIVRQMDIPPGKYYPFQNPDSSSASADPQPLDAEVQLRRYKYGDLKYPSYVTAGTYSGHVLLHSTIGIVAGEHPYEQGSVLFVNLPLGYLKANTDGLLLHAFLKYFAQRSLGLPSLMSVPDGIGGLVLNLHVDSNAAIKPLQQMKSWALLQQGPYSVHITAGPDAGVFGDHKGFDVDHNPASQELIREHMARGDAIGSHGGWIHDYFAAHVSKDDPKDLVKYLELNKDSLEKATGKPVVEYSAPDGNQPPWVTHWLDTHGFLAYYFTGDTGMGPTQGYRDGLREAKNIWAFPITHLDRAAGFEEMFTEGYSTVEVEHWLEAITNFTVDHRCVRLVYFHPPGVLRYQEVVDQWMGLTARLQTEKKFRWYTMTEMANFMDVRKQARWKATQSSGVLTLNAAHPQSLEHLTWRLPVDQYAEPSVAHGSAQVVRDADAWLVIAGPGKDLEIQSKLVSK